MGRAFWRYHNYFAFNLDVREHDVLYTFYIMCCTIRASIIRNEMHFKSSKFYYNFLVVTIIIVNIKILLFAFVCVSYPNSEHALLFSYFSGELPDFSLWWNAERIWFVHTHAWTLIPLKQFHSFADILVRIPSLYIKHIVLMNIQHKLRLISFKKPGSVIQVHKSIWQK